jgi:hypothetical protein
MLLRRPTALTQLGRALSLADDAGLLEETSTPHLREDPIGLDLLVETAHQRLYGFTLFCHHTGHWLITSSVLSFGIWRLLEPPTPSLGYSEGVDERAEQASEFFQTRPYYIDAKGIVKGRSSIPGAN